MIPGGKQWEDWKAFYYSAGKCLNGIARRVIASSTLVFIAKQYENHSLKSSKHTDQKYFCLVVIGTNITSHARQKQCYLKQELSDKCIESKNIETQASNTN